MFAFGEEPQPLILDVPPVLAGENDQEPPENPDELPAEPRKTVPPKHDEIIWAWKVRIILIFSVLIHNTTLSKIAGIGNDTKDLLPIALCISRFHHHHVVIAPS